MNKVNLFVIMIFMLIISLAYCGYLTPEHIQEHIKRLISQKYQLYVINLGTTVNNNPLKAYVISGVKKQQSRITQLQNYPATLITSYMHPRQPYSVKLMQTVLDDVLNNYNSDYFFRYMLDHTLLILFPFVNIDGYYLYHRLTDQGASQTTKQQYRKNLNHYGKCLMDWQYGVDINRNFDSAWGSLRTSDSQCGEQYRGPNPFSQKQSKAIKTLFNKFKINLAIDIHSYGNQWIYPYASQSSNNKLQSNKLYPLYKDLFKTFQQYRRPMKSCYQSLKYTADGVYIDWALDQGALSFAVQVGSSFDGDTNLGAQLLFQTEQLFHKVLRKNSISYSKYRTRSNELVILSTSLLNFEVEAYTQDQTFIATKKLPSRKAAIFLIDSKVEIVVIKIQDTKIEETIELLKLQIIDSSQIPGYQDTKFYLLKAKALAKVVIIVLSIVGLLAGGYFVYRKNTQKQKQIISATANKPQTLQQQFHDKLQMSKAELKPKKIAPSEIQINETTKLNQSANQDGKIEAQQSEVVQSARELV